MKIVLQRVKEASCFVDGNCISAINKGFLLLVGFTHTDTKKDVEYLAKKVAHLRIFEDQDGKLNKSILEMDHYEILSISQFTIYGNTKKGNRPSFTEAMKPDTANNLYEYLQQTLMNDYHINVQGGAFGQHMDIRLVNDGPVTIILESK